MSWGSYLLKSRPVFWTIIFTTAIGGPTGKLLSGPVVSALALKGHEMEDVVRALVWAGSMALFGMIGYRIDQRIEQRKQYIPAGSTPSDSTDA